MKGTVTTTGTCKYCHQIRTIEHIDEDAAKIFTAGLRAMAEGDIQSIQVKAWNGVKYQMTRKEKKIVVKSVETSEEESSGDESE